MSEDPGIRVLVVEEDAEPDGETSSSIDVD